MDDCRVAAVKNYPLLKQKELLKSSTDRTISNLTTGYYPQVEIGAQATYQSDVTKVPIPENFQSILKIPVPSKDHYLATFDIKESIYDGGLIHNQKVLLAMNMQVEQQKVEVELYKLKDNVNRFFFAIILAKENSRLLELLKEDVRNKLKKVESGVMNGVALESNANVLRAELLKIDQKMLENDASGNAAFDMLAELTGKTLNKDAQLQMPEAVSTQIDEKTETRPEFTLYSLQQKATGLQQNLITSKTLPKIGAFVQFGYGRPGLNVLSNDFQPYYIGGIKATWGMSAFYTAKNEKEIQKINADIVNSQKETFNKNLLIALKQQKAEITKLEELLKKDEEITALRKKIVASASAQMENGVITATEYLTELNAQNQAETAIEQHKIQLLYAKIGYLTLQGK